MFTSARTSGFGRTLDPFDARDGGPVRTDAGYHLERSAVLPPALKARMPIVQAMTSPMPIPWTPPPRVTAPEQAPPLPGVAAGTPPVDAVVGAPAAPADGPRFPFFVLGLLLAVYLATKD